MRSLYFSLFAAFSILFAGFLWFSDAAADENTCIIKVDTDKIHLIVYDEDSDQDRQDKIFEGWLKSGQLQKLQSATGFIVYSYKKPEDDRSYGDNHKRCKGGNTIRVP